MGILKGIFGKGDEEKDKTTTQPKGKETEKQLMGKVEIIPKVEEKVEKVSLKDDDEEEDKDKVVPKKVFYKPVVDKKLTIILIENTLEVAKEKDMIMKIIKNVATEGLVCIINYGSIVRRSEIVEAYAVNKIPLLENSAVGNMACLYDALVDLQSLVYEQYMKVEEKQNERVKINKIEVIGIGTCRDNCSKFTKEIAIDCFCEAVNKPEVITKYFCLTEETFMQAAEIGFRSIGAIRRNY